MARSTGDPSEQVTDPRWFPTDQLFPIANFDEASQAIDVIVRQGEGTKASPFDESQEIAHYYRFAQIVYARRLVPAPDTGWAYAGEPVGIDPAGVWDICSDPKAADYPEDSQARVLADMFNSAYTNLLGCLHQTFNGQRDLLAMALSVMVEMQLIAEARVHTGAWNVQVCRADLRIRRRRLSVTSRPDEDL